MKTITIKRTKIGFMMLFAMVTLLILMPSQINANQNRMSQLEIDINLGAKTGSGFTLRDQWVVFDEIEGATYYGVSSNEDIVTVGNITASGNLCKAVTICGNKIGTSNITVYATISGKTTKLGTTKVNVVNATINATKNYNHEYGLGEQYAWLEIQNKNLNAAYSFKTSSDKVKVYFHNNKSIMVNATEYGTYTVTPVETINGVDRILPVITIHIKPLEIVKQFTTNPEMDNQYIRNDFLKCEDTNYTYGLFIENKDYNFYFNINGNLISYVSDRSDIDTSKLPLVTMGHRDNSTDKQNQMLDVNQKGTYPVSLYRTKKGTDKSEKIATIMVTRNH